MSTIYNNDSGNDALDHHHQQPQQQQQIEQQEKAANSNKNDSNNDVASETNSLNNVDNNNQSSMDGKGSYRQKYKRAWELDTELRDWLSPCLGDQFAAFCKFCRCKLHAHKKGLLAHAKSCKHKKHLLNPNDSSVIVASNNSHIVDQSTSSNDGLAVPFGDAGSSLKKQRKSSPHNFNDMWLNDPLFAPWLRKVQTNLSKALCIACRCVITAGRSELLKHSQAAKHKKAALDGPFEEVGEIDLDWLDPSFPPSNISANTTVLNIPSVSYNQMPMIAKGSAQIQLPGLPINEVLQNLNEHVPLMLAESWDNVGVITQPTLPIKVYNILLTIDLNEKIVEEALKKRAQFIISYHPPIFRPTKSLNPSNWMDKAILMCIENRIAVYSPHTALDAVKGGINDWLISAFLTGETNKIRPIKHSRDNRYTAYIEALLPESQNEITQALQGVKGVDRIVLAVNPNVEYGGSDVRASCDDDTLPEIYEVLLNSPTVQNPVAQFCNRVTKLASPPIPGVGMGRLLTLDSSLPLYEVVHRMKQHLDQTNVRLALSPRHTRDTKVTTIAVCAGSGGSILKGCSADVWITGEMSHHEVLDAIHRGSSVILCEHSNTERGFLKQWSKQLKSEVLNDIVNVFLSEIDKDPVRIV